MLPPCRAGPVCPAGINAVFCGGTHGSRPTDRCGKPSVGDGVPYTPCHCEPVRAAKQVPLGYRLARQSVFPALALDKPAGMGIIISRRGRCDKRSAPELVNDFNGLYSPQKPSPARVAVFAFQSLDSYRDRMTQNMNRENEKHVCHPPLGAVTNRLPFIAASLRCIISRLSVFVNLAYRQPPTKPLSRAALCGTIAATTL